MLGEFLTAVNLFEKLSRYWKQFRVQKESTSAESVAARFVRLFESHGVHKNQIPRFIGHGLTVKDMQGEESLLAKLDEPLLEEVCEMFAVRREWLDGADTQIHPCHDFYKKAKDFERFIEELIASNPNANLHGVVIAPEKAKRNAEALIILQEEIGWIGEKPIYRFHLCNDWYFSYWKARAYLTACVAIAWKYRIYLHGVYLSNDEIIEMAYGRSLLGWQGEGIHTFGSVAWYPEDMALSPEAFLEGVDPEKNSFGIVAGLNRWLALDDKGLMDAGLGKDARKSFEKELAKNME